MSAARAVGVARAVGEASAAGIAGAGRAGTGSGVTHVDVLVVGAGPAGLSAAAELGDAGLSVAVLDEYPIPGGRLTGQYHKTASGGVWDGRRLASDLHDEAAGHASVAVHLRASVYALGSDGDGWVVDAALPTAAGSTRRWHARALLLATGATELPLPLPGWTLPGVVTVGGAQTLAGVWGRVPGKKGVIIGTGALTFPIAQELRRLGVDVGAIVMPPQTEATLVQGTLAEQWSRLLSQRSAAPAWARPGAALLAKPFWRRMALPLLPKAGMPVFGSRLRLNVAALALEGEERVEAVVLQRVNEDGHLRGRPWREPIDFACLSGSLRPLPELVRAAGAAVVPLRGLGGDVPLLGPDGQTTVPGVYAAGNATGVEGAAVAMAQGRLAGLSLAQQLTASGSGSAIGEAREKVEAARRAAPFRFHPGIPDARRRQADLWEAYVSAPPTERVRA